MILVSTLVNLLGLASSLWLGFYIVTRSPRSRVSWLTALALWCLSCFFLANAIAINAPQSDALLWPRFLILFALPLWLHLTVELIAIGAPSPRRLVSPAIVRVGIGLSYAFALFLVLVGIFAPKFLLDLPSVPRLYTSDPGVGPLFGTILIFLLINIALALGILYHGRRAALTTTLRRQFTLFLVATVFAALGGWYVAAGTYFDLRLPAFLGDGMLAAGVTFLGYVVAKYNALIEGRRVEKDFLYAMLAVGSLTLFYVLITLVFYLGNQISFLTLVLTIIGSLSFNALYDGVRVALDRFFYRGQFVRLRQDLRVFARELGTGQRLDEQLQTALVSFCRALCVQKGFIAIRENDTFIVRAALDANPIGASFPLASLTATESIGLVLPERKGLPGMALLVPLQTATEQIGAIVLGEKEDKKPYSEQELEFLDEVAEMARVIFATRAQEENIEKINALVAEYRERERALQMQLNEFMAARSQPALIAPSVDEEEMAEQVEDALRHLHDYAYLGEHALVTLQAVQDALKQSRSVISIDRGKALSEILLCALDKIKPNGPEPKPNEIPAREWHPYIILHDSYVRDESNRNVMARLYVGEGTFNRTRRRALNNMTKALREMERNTTRTDVPSGTVTFLFTDIEGSSKLWQEHRDAMQAALARHDALMRQAIQAHKGFIFKTVGDGFCAAFPTAQDALAAALAAQRALTQQQWNETPIKVRMGLHTNSAQERDGDYFGPPLNRLARLLSAGHGGQILLSLATQELLQDHLPAKIELRDMGEHRLKDIVRAEHIYQVIAPDLSSEFPALKTQG